MAADRNKSISQYSRRIRLWVRIWGGIILLVFVLIFSRLFIQLL